MENNFVTVNYEVRDSLGISNNEYVACYLIYQMSKNTILHIYLFVQILFFHMFQRLKKGRNRTLSDMFFSMLLCFKPKKAYFHWSG